MGVAAGFAHAPPDPSLLHFCVALYNHLPLALPVLRMQLGLEDEQGQWVAPLLLGMPAEASASAGAAADAEAQAAGPGKVPPAAASSTAQAQQQQTTGKEAAAVGGGSLPPGTWHLCHAAIAPRCAGRLQVRQLQLQLSPHTTVTFQLGSFPPAALQLLSGSVPGGTDGPFKSAIGVRMGQLTVGVQHVGPLPQVTLQSSGLALAGEFTPVQLEVRVVGPLVGARIELSLRHLPEGSAAAAQRTAPGGGAGTDAGADAGALSDAPPPPLALLARSDDGALQALPPEGASLTIRPIAADSTHTVLLWVRAAGPTAARLSAVLLCPAHVPRACELTFEDPFQTSVRLFSETGVHTLAPPPPHAAAQRAQEGAGGGGASGGRSALPLVVGQAVLAQVAVQAVQDAEMELLGVSVQIPEGSGIQVGGKSWRHMMQHRQMSCVWLHLVSLLSLPTS